MTGAARPCGRATRTVLVRGCVAWLMVAAALVGSAAAQTIVPEPPGPYVIDVRGAMVGIPQSGTLYPNLPGGTIVPARGFGGELGAHVYPLTLWHHRLGFGVTVGEIRGTATTVVPPSSAGSGSDSGSSSSSSSSSGSTTLPVVFPDIRSWERFVTPQVSMNFGTHDGWSYLSVGYGTVREKTEAIYPASASTTTNVSERGANFGGGARWFVNAHMAVGFDVRFYRLPSATLVGVNAGVSLR